MWARARARSLLSARKIRAKQKQPSSSAVFKCRWKVACQSSFGQIESGLLSDALPVFAWEKSCAIIEQRGVSSSLPSVPTGHRW